MRVENAEEQIEFLGLKIDRKGIKMQHDICKKITNFPDTLIDTKQVERLQACINYINDFIPNLAWMRGPLQDLSKKMVNRLQDRHTSLVHQIKKVCTQLSKLAMLEANDQLIVETDTFDKYCRGVLKGKKTDGKE